MLHQQPLFEEQKYAFNLSTSEEDYLIFGGYYYSAKTAQDKWLCKNVPVNS